MVSLNFILTLVLGQNGLFDVLRIADQSSTYLTLTDWLFFGYFLEKV
jgi:hypothetical protein